jgi:DNA polymerase-3 subunit delta'
MAWSHILGHERQVESFRQIVARKRLAQGYLFVGPSGIGKRLFARELAKALLCEAKGAALEACDRCDACRLVDAGTHPDFFTVSRPEESNELPIETMQGLCKNFALKAARGHGKVAILEDADDLNEFSANCFLKTLEEPPPRSTFILIGTGPERQLDTILSRTQIVRFAPLSDEQVAAILDKHGVTTARQRLVSLAAGSPGQALELADEALWLFRGRLLAGLVTTPVDVMGLTREFVDFVEEAGKEGSLQRRRAMLMLRLLLESLSDALRLTVSGEPRSASTEELPLLAELAQRAGADRIMALTERCLETEAQVGRYVQLSLVLEGLLDGMARLLENPGPVPVRLG